MNDVIMSDADWIPGHEQRSVAASLSYTANKQTNEQTLVKTLPPASCGKVQKFPQINPTVAFTNYCIHSPPYLQDWLIKQGLTSHYNTL